MNKIMIADRTLCFGAYSFKEKIEIARQLEKLSVDTIEIAEITNAKSDVLFVKTIASFVNNSVLSVAAGSTLESVEQAAIALSNAKKSRIRIELPVSPVGMEYTCHKKAPKMLEWIKVVVSAAKEKCNDVEFCAIDATRAEIDFLTDAVNIAVETGANIVSVCDTAGGMLPDDFAEFAKKIADICNVPVGVGCDNKNGFACAQAILSVKNGVEYVKTSVGNETVSLETFATMVKNCGESYGFKSDVSFTQLNRIIKQIEWVTNNAKDSKSALQTANTAVEGVLLDSNDDQAAVISAVSKLGYDLSEDDQNKVYDEFLRVVDKKKVGSKELDAIVASVALQVPATYKLVSYVINTGNIISASAQITVNKGDKEMQGISVGDGPIDAAFLAIGQIIGHHYELDDFQIQSVTEGREAMGSAVVKLRADGKLYSGNGISTDIIGASIRAYLNAVNKIVYEEG